MLTSGIINSTQPSEHTPISRETVYIKMQVQIHKNFLQSFFQYLRRKNEADVIRNFLTGVPVLYPYINIALMYYVKMEKKNERP